jgi:hypothetical protein
MLTSGALVMVKVSSQSLNWSITTYEILPVIEPITVRTRGLSGRKKPPQRDAFAGLVHASRGLPRPRTMTVHKVPKMIARKLVLRRAGARDYVNLDEAAFYPADSNGSNGCMNRSLLSSPRECIVGDSGPHLESIKQAMREVDFRREEATIKYATPSPIRRSRLYTCKRH